MSRTTGNETLTYLKMESRKRPCGKNVANENSKWGSESAKIITRTTSSSSAATTTANSATNITTFAESTTYTDGLIWKTFQRRLRMTWGL